MKKSEIETMNNDRRESEFEMQKYEIKIVNKATTTKKNK
jgi:hypothetical protein